MKLVDKLLPPFTPDERAQFVVKHNCINIVENEEGLFVYEQTDNEILADEAQTEINKILIQLNEIDQKRIRASLEPSVKDKKTGETWLEYYNNQVVELRNRMDKLKKDIKVLIG